MSAYKPVGFIDETLADGTCVHSLGSCSKLWLAQLQSFYTFLEQVQIQSYLVPQGCLQPDDIDLKMLKRHTLERRQTILCEKSQAVAKERSGATSSVPPQWPQSFFTQLAKAGGEEIAAARGVLIIRAEVKIAQQRNLYFQLTPPTIAEESTRLWRRFPCRRLLRVKLDKETSQDVQKGSTASNLLRGWQASPLFLLGQTYEFLAQKDRSLNFFATKHSLPGVLPTASIADIYDELIPFRAPANDDMTLAKYGARMQLWLSKSKESLQIPPEGLIWVPDRTNHTLPMCPSIYRSVCARIAEQIGKQTGYYIPKYSPSILRGYVGNDEHPEDSEMHTWYPLLARRPEDRDKVAVLCDGPLPSDVSIRFVMHAGPQRAKVVVDEVFVDAELLNLQRPSYPEAIMTDGNGIMSRGVARHIYRDLGLDEGLRSAVQARLEGSKGMWHIAPTDRPKDDSIWMEIRESQHKYTSGPNCPWTVDVLHVSGPKDTGGIGSQTQRVLLKAQQDAAAAMSIATRVNDLRILGKQQARVALLEEVDPGTRRAAIEYYGHLKWERSQRGHASDTYQERTRNYRDDEDDDFGGDTAASTLEGYEELLSGRPKSTAEQALEMNDAGFRPEDPVFQLLLGKVAGVFEDMTKSEDDKAWISIKKSRIMYVISDPTGLLKDGQIFCQMGGETIVDDVTCEKLPPILLGELLISRTPCVAPTDLQRVTAVDIPELHCYWDVIVCPVRGKRSLLSMLSGGDYDGDMATLLFDTKIVKKWKNADEKYLEPPEDLDKYFSRKKLLVKNEDSSASAEASSIWELKEAIAKLGLPQESVSTYLQRALFEPVFVENVIGNLHKAYEQMVDAYGLLHPETWLFSYLYTQSIDAPKSGTEFVRGSDWIWEQKKKAQNFRKAPGVGDDEDDEDDVVSLSSSNSDSDEDSFHDSLPIPFFDDTPSDRFSQMSIAASQDTLVGSPVPWGLSNSQPEDLDLTLHNAEADMSIAPLPKPPPKSGGKWLEACLVDSDILQYWDAALAMGIDVQGSELEKNIYQDKLVDTLKKANGDWYSRADLEKLEAHVKTCLLEEYPASVERCIAPRREFAKAIQDGASKRIIEKNKKEMAKVEDRTRTKLVERFYSFPHLLTIPTKDVPMLAAACAYVAASKVEVDPAFKPTYFKFENFPYLVSWRYVMKIKAEASERRQTGTSLPPRSMPQDAYLAVRSSVSNKAFKRSQQQLGMESSAQAESKRRKSLNSSARR